MSKKILIVGGTSGLGRKLAELYAEEKNIVGITGRREDLLNEFKNQFPENSHILLQDISTQNTVQDINDIVNRMGGVDIIIIPASIIELNEALQLSTELKTTNINVSGFTTVINAAWQYFKQKGGGHIVGVTSVAAARGNRHAPAYHASKAYQSVYLESLRIKAKFEKISIIITELIPGYMDTEMAKGNRLFWMSTIEKQLILQSRQ
ncbi:MAG: SDR family NAD(P)-dependent oxidoreductase [Chitinophagaceae bacterium]|nr:SDR family NAD(P)-dependent oxidoreductase [Chitinophagaceae bacterium]